MEELPKPNIFEKLNKKCDVRCIELMTRSKRIETSNLQKFVDRHIEFPLLTIAGFALTQMARIL